MKAFAKFSSVVLFVLLLPLFSQAAEKDRILFGINVSYIHSFCDVNPKSVYDRISPHYILSGFKGKSMGGFGIGFHNTYLIFDNNSISHRIGLRTNYERFDNTVISNSYQVRDGIWDREYSSLELNYVNFDLYYCFNFLNKHIGVEIGPSVSFLIDNEVSFQVVQSYSEAMDPGNLYPDKAVVYNIEPYRLEEKVDYYFTMNIGLNFPFKFKELNLIPYLSFKPRTFIDVKGGNLPPFSFKTNNLSAGLIVRY